MKLKTAVTVLALAAGLSLGAAHANTLRWAAQNDILTLDPHSQNHATTNAILQHAYEGLTRYNAKYEVEPALATKWTYISPTQVRFELRRGVKFHDGSPLTADDVVFSFGRIRQPQGTMGIYVTGINEVKKVDDHTVDFILSGPNPILLRNIADFFIMSKTWAEKNKTTNTQDYKNKEENFASRNVNGTGGYMITGWTPDQRITMKANPNWWDKPQGNVTEVVYTPIKADATRIAALLSDDVDMVTDLPTQDVARIRNDPKLKVVDGHEVRTIFIALDQHNAELKHSDVKGKNPFKDKRVREALNISVDREAIKRATMRGLSLPAGILVAPGVNGHSPDIDVPPKVDVERAKKLLAEAGYPNGFQITIHATNDRYPNDEKVVEAVAQFWTRIGVTTEVDTMPRAVFFSDLIRGAADSFPGFDSPKFSMSLTGWGTVAGEATYTVSGILETYNAATGGGNGNFGRYSNPSVDAKSVLAKQTIDRDARLTLLQDATRMAMEDYAIIPLHFQVNKWAMRAGLDHFPRTNERTLAIEVKRAE